MQSTAARLNNQWRDLIEEILTDGAATGEFDCPDPRGSAWRLLGPLDGLTIQVVAQTDGPGRMDVEECPSRGPPRDRPRLRAEHAGG